MNSTFTDSEDEAYEYKKPIKFRRSRKQHKSKFSPDEDQQLIALVKEYGTNAWEAIIRKMPWRNERQCRDRWFYYLSPDLNKGPWTQEEDDLLIKSVKEIGPQWVKITKFFKGRTDVQIKNRWNIIKRNVTFDSDCSEDEDQEDSTNSSNISSASEPKVEPAPQQETSIFDLNYPALEDLFKEIDFSVFQDETLEFL